MYRDESTTKEDVDLSHRHLRYSLGDPLKYKNFGVKLADQVSGLQLLFYGVTSKVQVLDSVRRVHKNFVIFINVISKDLATCS